MSSANSAGVNTQLLKMGTKMDTILLGGTSDTSSGSVDLYRGYSAAGFLPFAVEWESYPLTKVTGINGYGGTECEAEIANIGGRIGRVAVVIRAPPICNTITNCDNFGNALATASGAILTMDPSSGDTLSGTFAVDETVSITAGAGGGSGFVGTVTAVNGSFEPTAITVTTPGVGYTAGATADIEGSGGATWDNVTITVGDTLSEFPAVGGRIIIPTQSSGPNNRSMDFPSIASTSITAASANILANCVITETMGRSANSTPVVTKSVTGITISDSSSTHAHVRAGGLATDSICAHYCYAAPFHLIRQAIFRAGQTDLFTITSATIMQYNSLWRSSINQLPNHLTHTHTDDFLLKCNSMTDVEWVVVLPFPFCHRKSMALPLPKSMLFSVAVTFNGWRDVLVNSPTYNANLSITSSSTVDVDSPAAATYASEIATYTVSGGKLGDGRISMLSAASATTVVVPSTPLTDAMFSAQLMVEHLRYDPATESKLKDVSFTRTVCLHRTLKTTLVDSSHDGTQEVMFSATLPTSHLYIETQRRSRALLNDRMNFSAVEDPLYRSARGGHLDDSVGPSGACFNRFYKSVRLDLESEQRMVVDTVEGSNLSLSSVTSRSHPQGTTGVLLPFAGVNPYDGQPAGAASMTEFSRRTLTINVNPAVLEDHQYIGGLPQDLFDATLFQYCYSQLKVDAVAGTMQVVYVS